MALSYCNTTVDERGYEQVQHGTAEFPLACYHDDLGEVEVPWHWHDELEIVRITEGFATVAIGSEKFTVGPGEGYFANAGSLHAGWDLNGSHCRFHSLVFHPRLVGGSPDSVFHRQYVLPLAGNAGLEGLHLRPDIPWQAEILSAAENAWQAVVSEPEGYAFTVRGELSKIVHLLWLHMPPSASNPGSRSARDNGRIKTMLQFIHSHYGDPVTAADIARSALISESECLRCFRLTIRTTPIQYLKQYRIQQACQLLAATREKIADIGAQCGFQDMSYFTKTFRQMKGCVPSEYRRRQREERNEAL